MLVWITSQCKHVQSTKTHQERLSIDCNRQDLRVTTFSEDAVILWLVSRFDKR